LEDKIKPATNNIGTEWMNLKEAILGAAGI
jgi:hypothetical protein